MGIEKIMQVLGDKISILESELKWAREATDLYREELERVKAELQKLLKEGENNV